MTDDATHELEDHIELLRTLDKKRKESARLRDEGLHTLPHQFDKDELLNVSNLNLFRALSRDKKVFSEDITDDQKKLIQNFITKCKKLSLEKISSLEVSVWFAANLLQTLVAIPGGAHLKATFYCYYWIIRELYTADSAEWSIGGARTDKGGQVTAYMTSECVSALLALAEAHKQTGEFLSAIDSFLERNNQLINLKTIFNEINLTSPMDKWIEREQERSVRSCYLSLKRHSKQLTIPELDALLRGIDPQDKDTFIENCKNFKDTLKNGINTTKKNICDVLLEIGKYRMNKDNEKNSTNNFLETEEIKKIKNKKATNEYEEFENIKNFLKNKDKDEVIRSHQGHHIARNAIMGALGQSLKALTSFQNENEKIYEKSYEILNDISNEIHKSLIPTRNYLTTILDHELAVGAELHYGQPEELTWAALSYGKLTNNWDKDNRLALATRRLMNTISDYGVFPNRRHFHFDPKKGAKQTETSCAINAFAQLLKYVRNVEIDNDIAKKLLRLLEDTRVIKQNGKLDGWRKDCSPVHWKSDSDATAQAVMALDEINDMLDERINQLILEHFSVKWPAPDLSKTPVLDQLFYSDYGLASFKSNEELKKVGIKRDESIAVTLLRMQAHVKKIQLNKTCNSMVLYGPAGTGKTTLVEALAKTCEVPMVEITPSDIVKRGVDNVERRARTVFEALSLLTRVVILFDEFDPVLKRRNPDNQNPSVFSFLTPGMLPKLKTLHDKAEKRSAAYVLITNLIGSLDEAAIRQGRFDEKIGIFPPDLLSRTGRFLDQVNKYLVGSVANIIEELEQINKKQGGLNSKQGEHIVKQLKLIKKIQGNLNQSKHIAKIINYLKPSEPDKPIVEITKDLNEIKDKIQIDLKSEKGKSIAKIIQKTAGLGMTALGKPEWFTCPKSYAEIKSQTPFKYLADFKKTDNNSKDEMKNNSIEPEWPEPEDVFKGEIKGEGNIAEKEYYEWAWITKCDKELEKSLKENVNFLNCLGQTLENLPQNVDLPLKKSPYYP